MKINHHIWADVKQGLEGPTAFASSRRKAFSSQGQVKARVWKDLCVEAKKDPRRKPAGFFRLSDTYTIV